MENKIAFLYEEGRFYLNNELGHNIAEITFTKAGDNILIIDHTWVDPTLRGQGIAGQLVAEVVKKAVAENKKIIPLCPFAEKEFKRNLEYHKIWVNHS